MTGSDLKGAKIPGAKVVTCPSCSVKISLLTYAQAVNVGCASCSKMFSVNGDNLKQVAVYKEKTDSLIELGIKVRVKGILFAVVGFVKYREYKTIYTWKEYVLFNPAFGYAFLSECEGHWNFIFQVYHFPGKIQTQSFEFNSKEYRVFQRYESAVVCAAGEFHWDISSTDRPTIAEFISPPFILTKENTLKSSGWYRGEYLEPSEVKKIFSISKKMPYRSGVGPTQLFKGQESLGIIQNTAALLLLFLVALQFVFAISSREAIVFQETYSLGDYSVNAIVSPSFKIEGGILGATNLESTVSAPVDNSWFEAGVTLVNEVTGEEFYFEQGVEYYSGYSGGEHWSEGSTRNNKLLSSIPEGRYHLNISPSKDYAHGVSQFSIRIVRDVTIWTNFLLLLLIILVYPVYLYFRARGFEYNRWINSDFSPYSSYE